MSLLGSLVTLKEQTHKTQLTFIKEDGNPSTIDLLSKMETDLDIVINRITTREAERLAYLNGNRSGWRGY